MYTYAPGLVQVYSSIEQIHVVVNNAHKINTLKPAWLLTISTDNTTTNHVTELHIITEQQIKKN